MASGGHMSVCRILCARHAMVAIRWVIVSHGSCAGRAVRVHALRRTAFVSTFVATFVPQVIARRLSSRRTSLLPLSVPVYSARGVPSGRRWSGGLHCRPSCQWSARARCRVGRINVVLAAQIAPAVFAGWAQASTARDGRAYRYAASR